MATRLSWSSRMNRPRAFAALVSVALGVAAFAAAQSAQAEPPECLSMDPAQWPSSSKPYFMVIVDTSGSMLSTVGSTNSCGYNTSGAAGNSNRIDHARCAVRNAVLAYAGEVNFGLAGYAWRLTGCPAGACGTNFNGCTAQYAATDNNFCGPLAPETSITGNPNVHRGAEIFAPMLQDHYWSLPPDPSNVPTIQSYVDNTCSSSVELGANSNTPIGGALFNMQQYFSGSYVDPFTNVTLSSPLGTLAQGERACRSINVILITDGDETCDQNVSPIPIAGGCRAGQPSYLNTSGERLASYEADRMFIQGVTVGGQNFKVRTHVIGFAGATIASLDHIAQCGGTGASYSTANEVGLSTALSNIIASSVKPETCDNVDNNCNGCTDEGYVHYCDIQQTCCAWSTDPQRLACYTAPGGYNASITPQNPEGDLTKLPCTTVAQQTQPAYWLCQNPKETCDNVDNNCASGIDEGITKCGSPLHCPVPEACNGQDDDCNGIIDDPPICPNMCQPSSEICDGCDNDCDGTADEGIAPIPCGLAFPPNCVGQLVCPQKAVPSPGACVVGGFNACNNNPQTEICDGIDNNCNSIIDDGIPSVPCVPANAPPGLNYGANSHCKMGQTQCVNGATVCNGWVGPDAEICDGIDNDCDFAVDENPLPGTGNACGINLGVCTPGITACVNGALVCQGGVGPSPEICDGLDNNCNGTVDDPPLADAPAVNGCWNDPVGPCNPTCTFANLAWCPPMGANCFDNGSLLAPCNKGTIVCAGTAGWVCQGPKEPAPEVCDGIDNDCDGAIDDGVQGVGTPCGSDVGECVPGVQQCVGGFIDCVGETGPTPEICDNLDNDCDGVIDNGIPVNGACTPPYDTNLYPGDRNHPPCQPGVLQCDGMGNLVCVGGVGPSPEICDGIDNDCDGTIDESGAPPDGLDGTANPTPPPVANIGDSCGVDVGVCKAGTYQCVNAKFACIGGQAPSPEQCDCQDNNCDGTVDNPNPNMMPPLCGTGQDCVNSPTFGCQCAEQCAGEMGCAPGYTCEPVKNPSDPSQTLGLYCVKDHCGDCTTKTVKDANMKVLCAPATTPPDANCAKPPVCACKGQSCAEPCAGITCTPPAVCTNYGPSAGSCVQDNCFYIPCPGCDSACNLGACVDDPCVPNPCLANEVCKPTADFTDHVCVPSCADVMCQADEVCKNGVCEKTCNPPCANGQVCDEATNTCVANQCMSPICPDGKCCDPVTGNCGNCPCEAVVCPDGQECKNGDCFENQGGAGGATSSSTTGTGGSADASNGSGATGPGAGNGGAGTKGVWGLSTGGGGCACDAAGAGSRSDAAWAVLALALAMARRRRSRGRNGSEQGVGR